MTSPIREIQVRCPNCYRIYDDWHRSSFNFSLGETYDPDYIDEASSSVCPACGYRGHHETLIVDQDGTFQDPEAHDDPNEAE